MLEATEVLRKCQIVVFLSRPTQRLPSASCFHRLISSALSSLSPDLLHAVRASDLGRRIAASFSVPPAPGFCNHGQGGTKKPESYALFARDSSQQASTSVLAIIRCWTRVGCLVQLGHLEHSCSPTRTLAPRVRSSD